MNRTNRMNAHLNPWYIQILSFFGSALAGGFFISFLAILDLLESGWINMLLGLLGILTTSYLSFTLKTETRESRDPILLSFFLQSYAIFLYGLDDVLDPSFATFLSMNILLQFVFYFIFLNSLSKFFVILNGFISLLLLINQFHFYLAYPFLGGMLAVSLVYFSKNENHIRDDPYFFYSIVICFLGLYLFPHILSLGNKTEIYLSYVLLLPATYYLSVTSFPELTRVKAFIILALLCLLFLPLVEAPGILASSFVIVIGLSNKSFFLTNLARLSLIAYFCTLYYQMETTLLYKSYFMLGSGALFVFTYIGWNIYDQKNKS
ncbi:MAG: DUF4401 domain-containing protein [Leptospiraceae bacterium]|nr:DUF4401 domain-containing protein [Leptospiraceae bacterium]